MNALGAFNQEKALEYNYQNRLLREGSLRALEKAGTLSQMVQSSGRGEAGDMEAPTITVTTEEGGEHRGQQGEHRGSKEIQVEHALVISPKHSDIEHILIPEEKLKKKCACCILM